MNVGRTGHLIDERAMWEIVRKFIIEQPDLAAQKLWIPQIVSLKSLQLPTEPLLLVDILNVFETKKSWEAEIKTPNPRTHPEPDYVHESHQVG